MSFIRVFLLIAVLFSTTWSYVIAELPLQPLYDEEDIIYSKTLSPLLAEIESPALETALQSPDSKNFEHEVFQEAWVLTEAVNQQGLAIESGIIELAKRREAINLNATIVVTQILTVIDETTTYLKTSILTTASDTDQPTQKVTEPGDGGGPGPASVVTKTSLTTVPSAISTHPLSLGPGPVSLGTSRATSKTEPSTKSSSPITSSESHQASMVLSSISSTSETSSTSSEAVTSLSTAESGGTVVVVTTVLPDGSPSTLTVVTVVTPSQSPEGSSTGSHTASASAGLQSGLAPRSRGLGWEAVGVLGGAIGVAIML